MSTNETSAGIPTATARRRLLRQNRHAQLTSTVLFTAGCYVATHFVSGASVEFARLLRLRDARRKMLANWARGDADDARVKTRTERGLCGQTRGAIVCRRPLHDDDQPHVFS
jgi:hypothetical protein